MAKKPLILMILDGFGIAPEHGNAIKAAKKPNLDRLLSENPVTQIGASGLTAGWTDGKQRGGPHQYRRWPDRVSGTHPHH